MRRSGICGHCGRAGHYRPTCPDFDPVRDARVPQRVRAALEGAGVSALEPATREAAAGEHGRATTDAQSWGMW